MLPSRRRLDGADAPAATTGATSGAGGPVSAAICSAPGRTRVVTGLMPAWRVNVRISPDWSGVDRVITIPSAPALAVRPDRCR